MNAHNHFVTTAIKIGPGGMSILAIITIIFDHYVYVYVFLSLFILHDHWSRFHRAMKSGMII